MNGILQILAIGLLATVAIESTVMPDKWCYKDHPILDGLLCYKACKPGYEHRGGGPVCWGTCPTHTTNLGLFCTKGSYGRGVGRTLRTCSSNTKKSGLLCYPACKSGFYGVGPVCWAHCKNGYTDDGALCRRNAHIYGKDVSSCPWYDKCGLCGGPWYNVCSKRRNCGGKCGTGYKDDGCTCRKDVHIYTKETYGRGVGEIMSCKPGEEKDGLLCYPHCKSGYKGVGPICWAICTGQTTDTGTQCQKNAYGRGVGRVIECLKLPTLKSLSNYQDAVELFKKADGFQKLTSEGCAALYTSMLTWFNIIKTINSCNTRENWNTISFSFSAGGAAIVATSLEVGLAIDTKTDKGMCFIGYCTGVKTDASMGADLAIGWWKSLGDILGKGFAYEIGFDIPFSEAGATLVFITTSENTYVGTQLSFGIGLGGPLPIEVGINTCITPEESTIHFSV